MNLKLTRLLSRDVQSVSSLNVTRVAVLQGLFCPTNKHKPAAISEATDDSCMWKESRTSVLFGRSGSGAIRF